MATKQTTKKKPNPDTLQSIVIGYFRQHGIKGAVKYLADRAGLSRTQIYYILGYAENGIGQNKDQLDPRDACFLIMQADEVLGDDERFEPTAVENYLRPLLEKFYTEQENKTK